MDIDKLIKQKTKGYYFRIDVGKDPITGKRRQQSFGPFKTKTEAKKELIKLELKLWKELTSSRQLKILNRLLMNGLRLYTAKINQKQRLKREDILLMYILFLISKKFLLKI
jgi:hypothetical protein